MIFNMLCIPCIAAVGAIKAEMGSWKWMWITLAFQTVTAYLTALLVNQIGGAIFEGGSIFGAVISVVIVAAVVALVLIWSHLLERKLFYFEIATKKHTEISFSVCFSFGESS